MSEKRNWGYYIKLLREQKGLLRTQVAAASGIAYKHLERIENGRQKSPTPALIDSLAKALGVARMQILDILYGLEPLPYQIPVYQKFPYEIGDEPMTFINVPHPPSKNARGFVAEGDLASLVHSGDYIVVDESGDLNGGDLVVCLVGSKMQLAKLRKVADELWLEGKKFKVKYRETKYVYKVISLHIVKHLENMTLAIVAGLVGLSGLIAGVVQLIT